MVLSTTTKTASMKSITNQNQGGGSKKAGLPFSVGRDSWFRSFQTTSGSRNTLADYGTPVVFGLRHTRNPNVNISRPIGSVMTPNSYWNMF
jgi:hypothetical protein